MAEKDKDNQYLKRSARGAFGNFAGMQYPKKLKSEGKEERIVTNEDGKEVHQFKINMTPEGQLQENLLVK